MKKIVFILGFLMLGMSCLRANPIPNFYIVINEFMFDEETGWKLEVLARTMEPDKITRLRLSSSTESSLIRYVPEKQYDLFVITPDSLIAPFDFRSAGDKITLEMFFEEDGMQDCHYDILVYGYLGDAVVTAPKAGESIVRIGHWNAYPYFAKTDIPSMGEENNLEGVFGALSGNVFDKNGDLVKSGNFYFDYFYYEATLEGMPMLVKIENGRYEAAILAQKKKFNKILTEHLKEIGVSDFQIAIDPGESYEMDLFLLEDLSPSNIADFRCDNELIRIFPNPAASGQAIHYEIDLPVKSMNCRLEIFAIDGRLIHQEKVVENNGAVNLPNALPAGVYLVHFKTNNKISYTTRMIIN